MLDVTALTKKQLNAAVSIFDAMKSTDLLPIHQIDVDSGRHELDRRLATEVFGFSEEFVEKGGPVDLLRLKLAQEPSIRGGKGIDAGDEEDGCESETEDG